MILPTLAAPHPSDLAGLRDAVAGTVIAPGDPEYDDARQVHYADVDRRPALIVRPASAGEVSRVVARATGLELAVRSGGHGGGGHGTSEGGIVIDLRDLRSMEIDVGGRTAWAGAGLTAGEYTARAGEHGLATGFGDTGSVGIGGITLGGGIGYLVRSHGLTIDDLLAAEIVTADGGLLHVDEESHPDLFWAIRGGGGNFGVVTRFRFRLHELATVVGGTLILPATPDVVAGFVAAAEAAPDALSTIAAVMKAPPMPLIPEAHHGRPIVFALMFHAGAPSEAAAALAPFRALAAPLADEVREVPYPQLFAPGEEHRPLAVYRGVFPDRLGAAEAAAILEHLERSTATMAVVQLRVLGGAMARVPADATAFAHRGRGLLAFAAAVYEDPATAAEHAAWVDGLVAALHPGEPDEYVNFLGTVGPERVRRAYPGSTWDRLREVKRRYDPHNLFRLNHNVPPAP